MAGVACQFFVRVSQREVGLGMVEFGNIVPSGGRVTSRAIFAQGSLVPVIFPMAVDAITRSHAMRFAFAVAVPTHHCLMLPGQRKVTRPVVKRVQIQKHNAKVAPFVISVAMVALKGLRFS